MAAKTSSGPQRTFLILGTLILVVVCLSLAQKVLIPLALAILLTFILMPVVDWLERKGLSRLLAVLVTAVLSFSLIGGACWGLAVEFNKLAEEITKQDRVDNITAKIESLRGTSPAVVDRLQDTWKEISKAAGRLVDTPVDVEEPDWVVRVWQPTSGYGWLTRILGPIVELAATTLLVIILVIFMLIRREDLRNRLIRLVGRGQLTVTTRTIDEAGQRISRFLLMQFTINLIFGTLLGVGLSLIGVQYAFLWGGLAGALRFIPYVGIWVAALMPFAYSTAVTPGWFQPFAILGVVLLLELFTFNVMEPLLFSHSTGVSPVALLVAVVFWTWLWGPIGLLLSTPLTTCLVVLGRFVPQLEFLDILLSSEPVLEPQVSFYQRLLAHDQDEALELVEEYLKTQPVDTVYDKLLLPALTMAKRDRERDDLTPDDEQFMHQVIRDILEDLVSPQQEISAIASGATPPQEEKEKPRPKMLAFGCPAQGEADELALEMFRQLVTPKGCDLEVGSVNLLSSEVLSWIKEKHPVFVCIAALPPGGLAHARYFCKRLHSQFPHLKIVVGRWGQKDNAEKVLERFRVAGADHVGTTLVDSRNYVIPLIQLAAQQEIGAEKREPRPLIGR